MYPTCLSSKLCEFISFRMYGWGWWWWWNKGGGHGVVSGAINSRAQLGPGRSQQHFTIWFGRDDFQWHIKLFTVWGGGLYFWIKHFGRSASHWAHSASCITCAFHETKVEYLLRNASKQKRKNAMTNFLEELNAFASCFYDSQYELVERSENTFWRKH